MFAIDGKFSFGSCFEDEVNGGLCFHHQSGVQRLFRWLRLLHMNALYEIPISSTPISFKNKIKLYISYIYIY